MNDQASPLARDTAAQYASWFRALADPTRVQILSLLARSGGPLTVGAITGAVDVGQSTVSAHLKALAEVGFVLAERRAPVSATGSTTDAWTVSRPRPTSSWAGPPRLSAEGLRPRRRAYDLQPPTRRPCSGRRADPPERQARLHEQAGFRIVGTRRRIGRHHGRWRDTGLIERRSAVVGVG